MRFFVRSSAIFLLIVLCLILLGVGDWFMSYFVGSGGLGFFFSFEPSDWPKIVALMTTVPIL